QKPFQATTTVTKDIADKPNLEAYELLWLDAHVYSTQDNLETLDELKQVIN
ncbi:unnamed protein product, partial [Didymodactylos carnosus]